jgi:hypothetical protein
MSVEKSMLVRKAMRNFDDIYDAYLVEDEDFLVDEEGNVYALVEKADEPKASAGRQVLGTVFPGGHGAIAGRKGKKLRAAGNEMGGSIAGSTVGAGAAYGIGRALRGGAIKNRRAAAGLAAVGGALGAGGGYAGASLGTTRAQRKGYYKPQDVEKGMPQLSPKQMKIAGKAGNPKKIDAADLAALRNRKSL